MFLLVLRSGADVVECTDVLVSTMSAEVVGMVACAGGWSVAGAGAGTWAARILASRASTTDWTCLPVTLPA